MTEKHRLKLTANWFRRKIFVPKGGEVIEKWRMLRNKKIYDAGLLTKYYSGDQIKKNEMGGACSTYIGEKVACMGLVRKPEGNRPLVRYTCSWGDNIKRDHQEMSSLN